MKKIISSLSSSESGYACGVKVWMKKNVPMYTDEPTQLFDYLICSLDCILFLQENPHFIFTREILDMEEEKNGFGKYTVNFKPPLPKLVSIHDLDTLTDEAISEFLDKCNRRLARWHALQNEKKQVIFIRFCVDPTEIHSMIRFCEILGSKISLRLLVLHEEPILWPSSKPKELKSFLMDRTDFILKDNLNRFLYEYDPKPILSEIDPLLCLTPQKAIVSFCRGDRETFLQRLKKIQHLQQQHQQQNLSIIQCFVDDLSPVDQDWIRQQLQLKDIKWINILDIFFSDNKGLLMKPCKFTYFWKYLSSYSEVILLGENDYWN